MGEVDITPFSGSEQDPTGQLRIEKRPTLWSSDQADGSKLRRYIIFISSLVDEGLEMLDERHETLVSRHCHLACSVEPTAQYVQPTLPCSEELFV
jgi:hypothetical protein|tara:strand:- start:30 stop:314 length:285 start_codon:yes stop_codon:yes gene_type:complete